MNEWPSWITEAQMGYVRELEGYGWEFEIRLREEPGYVFGWRPDGPDHQFQLHLHEPPINTSSFGRYDNGPNGIGHPRTGSLGATLMYAVRMARRGQA